TVSRVINDHPNVRDEVRERVSDVIRQQDFHPNTAARALAKNRSQILGLVIPQAIASVFADPYFPILIQGVAAACDQRGYYLMLSLVRSHSSDVYRKMIRGGHLDGVIVASAFLDSSFLRRLNDDRFPFVLIGHQPDMPEINCVDSDNARGAMVAAQHLARLGYSRIATITGPLTMVSARDRYEGFLKGLAVSSLSVPDALIAEGDFSEQGGYYAMQRLLELPLAQRPEALFVASDAMAAGALRALRAAGLRVPDDVAVVGFDDTPVATTLEPSLTTIRQPIEQLGFTAASVLINALERGSEEATPQRIVLPTELIIRESCGHMRLFRTPRSR
ncbi:MAG: LacI family DNA-binding transcriptional regulator, partial [Ardenticatenaceae bacterium]